MILEINKNNKGFTLIELIISITIFVILIVGAANLLVSILQNQKAQLTAMNNIDEARFVSSGFTNEIRAAAYGSYPLLVAQNSSITFYSPIGAGAGNLNIISYYLTGNTLYKEIQTPTGTNGAYVIASNTPVLTGITNGNTPLFYYYDGTYNGNGAGTPLTQLNLVQIKYVQMNLTVQSQTATQGTSTFSLNAGAAIRVLKNNLSN